MVTKYIIKKQGNEYNRYRVNQIGFQKAYEEKTTFDPFIIEEFDILEEAQKRFNEKNYLDSLYLDGNRNYYEEHYYIEKVDYDEDGEEVDWESELQELNEEQEKAYDFVREHFRNNLHKIIEKEEE